MDAENLSVSELVKSVNHWNIKHPDRPLTCGNDSSHDPLIAETHEGEVFIHCPDCDYQMGEVPFEVREWWSLRKHKEDGFCEGTGYLGATPCGVPVKLRDVLGQDGLLIEAHVCDECYKTWA